MAKALIQQLSSWLLITLNCSFRGFSYTDHAYQIGTEKVFSASTLHWRKRSNGPMRFNTNHELVYLWTTARMPVHSLIFINPAGSVIYSKYFQDTATSDYRLFFEQQLFKQTSPTWNRVSSVPSTVSVADVHVVYQTIGDMIVFASGIDDVDESILIEVLATIEKVLLDVLDQKSISEAQFLIPDNYGKFVISVDDMMSQGIIETFDAGLIGKLSKLKPL